MMPLGLFKIPNTVCKRTLTVLSSTLLDLVLSFKGVLMKKIYPTCLKQSKSKKSFFTSGEYDEHCLIDFD